VVFILHGVVPFPVAHGNTLVYSLIWWMMLEAHPSVRRQKHKPMSVYLLCADKQQYIWKKQCPFEATVVVTVFPKNKIFLAQVANGAIDCVYRSGFIIRPTTC